MITIEDMIADGFIDDVRTAKGERPRIKLQRTCRICGALIIEGISEMCPTCYARHRIESHTKVASDQSQLKGI